MNDLLQYEGKRVLVTGCASGMGDATARLLLDLGAEVHGLDYQQCELELTSFQRVDLRDPASIDAAAQRLGDKLDALFNCAGLGPTFSPLDIMKVNFIGTRYLTQRILPLLGQGSAIVSVASTAAMGWSRRIELHKEFLQCASYADAVRWAQDHAGVVGEGYSFSKEAVVVWTMLEAQELVRRGIRINCLLPGLTQTPMLVNQIAVNTAASVLERVIEPMGRPGRPEEMAFALVMTNSARASYMNGAALNVDGGRLALLAMGQVEPPQPRAPASS